MSLFDDSALRLRAQPDHIGDVTNLIRVRLLPTSTVAREMRVPVEAEGEVRSRYEQDGVKVLNVWVEGTGMLFGVPVGEVRRSPDVCNGGLLTLATPERSRSACRGVGPALLAQSAVLPSTPAAAGIMAVPGDVAPPRPGTA